MTPAQALQTERKPRRDLYSEFVETRNFRFGPIRGTWFIAANPRLAFTPNLDCIRDYMVPIADGASTRI